MMALRSLYVFPEIEEVEDAKWTGPRQHFFYVNLESPRKRQMAGAGFAALQQI